MLGPVSTVGTVGTVCVEVVDLIVEDVVDDSLLVEVCDVVGAAGVGVGVGVGVGLGVVDVLGGGGGGREVAAAGVGKEVTFVTEAKYADAAAESEVEMERVVVWYMVDVRTFVASMVKS